jgi:hypothetical protein
MKEGIVVSPPIPIVVNITATGTDIYVDREPVDVREITEEVVWQARFDFDIIFPEESPFDSRRVFRGGGRMRVASGPPRPESGGQGRTYKYIVVPDDKSGLSMLDPTVRPHP